MQQNLFISQLKQSLLPYRQQLVQHPLYTQLKNLQHLQHFASYHVFAVWDFMSLLKSLQNNLTCTAIPWQPIGNANTRYLINEIVLGEESDIDEAGNRISHFELYLQAMHQMGADTTAIQQLLTYVSNGITVQKAMEQLQLPTEVQQFVNNTFETIQKQPVYVQAAVFTFGREDLIPDMFIEMVKDLAVTYSDKIGIFKYYLERHIEVDGDHHSHLATEMVETLCGNDAEKWKQATEASIEALEKRKLLWDIISRKISVLASI